MRSFLMDFIRNLISSTNRFFPSFCLIVCLFFISSYVIVFEPGREMERILTRVILSVSFGILLCTFGTLLHEKFQNKISISKKSTDIVLIALSGLTYPILFNFHDDMYIMYGYFGVMLALFVWILYFSIKESASKTFSLMFKNSAFNSFACGIIAAGVSICIFAFDSLIFRFNDVWIMIMRVLVMLYVISYNSHFKNPWFICVNFMYLYQTWLWIGVFALIYVQTHNARRILSMSAGLLD